MINHHLQVQQFHLGLVILETHLCTEVCIQSPRWGILSCNFGLQNNNLRNIFTVSEEIVALNIGHLVVFLRILWDFVPPIGQLGGTIQDFRCRTPYCWLRAALLISSNTKLFDGSVTWLCCVSYPPSASNIKISFRKNVCAIFYSCFLIFVRSAFNPYNSHHSCSH